jgi:3-oxoadipate enol-lactonase
MSASRQEIIRAQARLSDGTVLQYTLHRGDPDRRLSLIHSLGMDRDFWDPVVPRLSKTASILVYDCRGHGASGKPPGPYTVQLFARDLSELLDEVGWRSTAVAGASMGGCISLAFAAAYPVRTVALGLIDTTAWYGPDAPKQWAERAERALHDGLAAMIDFQVTRWFSDRFRAEHPEIVQHCVEVFLRNDPNAYAETCRMLGACDLRAALPRIVVPTAVVVGEEDYATPIAMAEALHEGIAGSRLTMLRGARHLTPVEAPDQIAAELEHLLKVALVP